MVRVLNARGNIKDRVVDRFGRRRGFIADEYSRQLNHIAERRMVDDMKHTMAVVLASEEDYAAAVAGVGGDGEGPLRQSYEMPDGGRIKMGLEQLVPEMLFRPEIVGGGDEEGEGGGRDEGKEEKAEKAEKAVKAGGDDAVEMGRRGGLPSAVNCCIRACDMEIGRDLWDSIIVTGVRGKDTETYSR
jgi:hypothetical protein